MGKFKAIIRTVERTSDFTLTLDKQNRVCINSALSKELGHEPGNEYYLFYDEEDQRIGISKTTDGNSEPYKFDVRGYASARGFIRQTDFNISSDSVKLIFDGKEGNIYAFRIPGRKHIKLKQEKNGNLEAC